MKHFYCQRGRLCRYGGALLLFFLTIWVSKPIKAQGYIAFQGRVVSSADQEPLPGASVHIKGSRQGTTTDASGMFTYSTTDSKVGLRVSFIGYHTLDTLVSLPLSQELLLTLSPDEAMLEEVKVSTGYWESSKRLSTGNISKVTAEVIEKQPVSNPLAALIGRMPGVQVTQNTGVPGGGFSVQIRGRNSISSGNAPLYIIDGVVLPSVSLAASNIGNYIVPDASQLSNIDPANIESIEVLKDADATAIYGSRGANGVVRITTKKGETGKPKVDVQFTQGSGNISHRMELLNTEQYLAMRREAFANDNAVPSASHYDVNGVWSQERYTDWQQYLIGGKSSNTNARVTLSGGNATTRYSFGTSFRRETTVFPGDFRYYRIGGNFSLEHESSDKRFRATFSGQYGTENNNLFGQDLTGFILELAPNSPPLYDDSGAINWENNTFSNPIGNLINKYNADTEHLLINAIVKYELAPGLQLLSSMGYNTMRRDELKTNPLAAYNPAIWHLGSSLRQSFFSNNKSLSWIMEPQLSWDKSWRQTQLKILAGGTLQHNVSKGKVLLARGFNSDLLLENPQAAASLTVSSSNYSKYRYTALFGRAFYDWKNKYLINLTVRRDGSSRFGPENRFANFGAVGAAWLFSEENLVRRGLPFLSMGKFRMSYGTTGNDQIGDYQYQELWGPTANPYQNGSGSQPMRIAVSDFAWEINKKWEAGLELGFKENSLFLSVSYFRNTSSNQLISYTLPPSTGFSSLLSNLPATVRNTGWEFSVEARPLRQRWWSWNTSLNVTLPKNRLVQFPDLERSLFANQYQVGYPVTIEKRLQVTGVDALTGTYTFLDQDGDGTISRTDDLIPVNIAQTCFGGYNNSLRYKSWHLNVFVQFVRQTGKNYMTAAPPGYWRNQPTAVLERWQNEGDAANIQKFTQTSSSPAYSAYVNARNFGDAIISDASFIRLKNVAVSYNLENGKLKGLGLEQARLFFQAQNLVTITDFLGLDPENPGQLVLPPLRMMVAGIQLSL